MHAIATSAVLARHPDVQTCRDSKLDWAPMTSGPIAANQRFTRECQRPQISRIAHICDVDSLSPNIENRSRSRFMSQTFNDTGSVVEMGSIEPLPHEEAYRMPRLPLVQLPKSVCKERVLRQSQPLQWTSFRPGRNGCCSSL